MKIFFSLFLITAISAPQEEFISSYEYLKLASVKLQNGDYYIADSLFHKTVRLARKEGDQNIEAKAFINLGNLKYSLASWDSAIHYYQESLPLYRTLQDTIQIANNLRNIGITYSRQGNQRNALVYLLRALETLGSSPDFFEMRGRIINSIANKYLEIGNTRAAQKIYNQYIPEYSGSVYYSDWLMNLGSLKLEVGEYDSSLYYYYESIKKFFEQKDSVGLGRGFNNIGEAYLRNGELESAKVELEKALSYKERVSPAELVSTYNNLAWLYIQLSEYDLAQIELERSASKMKESMREQEVLKYYFLKRLLAKEQEDYSTYIHYDELHDSLSSKIFEEERLQLQEMQAEFDINQREERIGQQEELLAAQQTIITKNTNLLILVIIIALIVLGSAIYFVLLNSRNKKLRMRNELLVREQNHRVKNNLQMISSLLSLQAGKAQDEVSKDALKQSQGRIQAIALLNRSLYDQEEIGDIDLKVYISELITEVINSITDTEVKYQLDIDNIKLDLEKTTSLGLIINELIVNSVKYVMQSVTEFSLSIKVQSGKFSLEYTDNGENFDLHAYQNSKSFGKKLVELQAKQLKGKSKISNDSQFRYQLNFS